VKQIKAKEEGREEEGAERKRKPLHEGTNGPNTPNPRHPRPIPPYID